MQAFFDERQDITVMGGLDINDAIGMQARVQETGSKEIAPGQAPENRSLEPGRDAGREQGGGAGKLGGRSRFDDLVQAATCQAMARQVLVYGWDAEGQGLAGTGAALQARDLPP